MRTAPLLLYLAFLICYSCSSGDDAICQTAEGKPYYPPLTGSSWETVEPRDLGWNVQAITELNTFLSETNTKAFIVLVNGKIAIESYFNGGSDIEFYPWNSAGKTLTAFTVGLADQKGLISLNDPTSDYLSQGWTSMTPEQENAITIRNQLTMTSGGDHTIGNTGCYDPECLQFRSDPGTEWYYHNAFYTLLQPVLDEAIPSGFESFFNTELKNKTGMNGRWINIGYNTIYFSTARSMTRFGLLNLYRGNWNGTQLLDEAYWEAMTTTSQDLNPAYGYLWWLNGKSAYILPGSTTRFSGKLIPAAPDDLIAGLGANDKKLYVIPSENMVIVRLGGAGNTVAAGPTSYDNVLWHKLNAVFN